MKNKQLKTIVLSIAVFANIFMGVWGITLWVISKESLISVDGFFSLIAAASISVLLYITVKDIEGEKRKTWELWYTVMRTSLIIAFLIYRTWRSVDSIVGYHDGERIIGGEIPYIKTYAFTMSVICFSLSALHKWTYIKTDKQENVFKVESSSSFIDGVVSILAGIILVWFEITTFTGDWFWFNFIGLDSILVLFICVLSPQFFIQWYKATKELIEMNKGETSKVT